MTSSLAFCLRSDSQCYLYMWLYVITRHNTAKHAVLEQHAVVYRDATYYIRKSGNLKLTLRMDRCLILILSAGLLALTMQTR